MIIDWAMKVIELERVVGSGKLLSERLDMPYSTLNGLKNEYWIAPKNKRGLKILALHEELVGSAEKVE